MAEGNKLPVEIVISAVDNVTYKVMAINEKLRKATEPVRKVQSAFSSLSEEAGLGKFASALGNVGSKAKGVMDEIWSLGGKLAGLLAGGGLLGGSIIGLVKHFGDLGDGISSTAARLGMSTQAFQEYSYAAIQSNISQEEFVGAMGKLSKNMAEASVGMGEGFVGFQALGISVRDSTGKIRSLESVLPELADKLSGIKSQSLKNAIAMKLMGKSAQELNEFFRGGAAGIEELRAESRKLGGIMDEDQIKKAKEMDATFKAFHFTVQGLSNTVAAVLAPIVGDLMKKLQDYLIANRERVEAFAKSFGEKLPGYIDQAIQSFDKLVSASAPLVQAFDWLAERFGGANVILGALALWLGGPLIGAVLGLAGALINLVVASIVPLSTILTTLLVPALTWVSELLIGMAAALLANPIGLAIAALVAGGVLLYNTWKPFADLVDGVGAWVKSIFTGGASVSANISQSSTALAAPTGALRTVDANAPRSLAPPKGESEIRVLFPNAPQGTRVETTKKDDLHEIYTGVTMGATS